MVDVELTDVEMKSQRSQPSVQSASIKEDSSSDENKSQSSLLSGGPDPTGEHPESSVPTHSVEAALEDKDEDSITLPAAKLEEWLKHGIRILRENRRRTKGAGSDPKYEALENESKNPGPQTFEASSLPDRVFDTPIDGQLIQQSINEFLPGLGDQQWFTATQRKFVDPFFYRACGNPFRLKEISPDSPLKITIDKAALSDFQPSDFDGFGYFGESQDDETFEPSFETIWQKYFIKLYRSHPSFDVAHSQWYVAVRKSWLRRRLIATAASRESIIIGTCYAQMVCNGATYRGHATIGSVLSYCFRTGVLSRVVANNKKGIRLLADIMPTFDDYLRLEPDPQPYHHRPISFSVNFRMWLSYIKTEEALALELHEFMLIIRFLKEQPTFPISRICNPSSTSLVINDLNFKSLKAIGGLQLVWTDVLEEHLLLNPETKQLFVAFFGSVEEFSNVFDDSRDFPRFHSNATPIWNAFDPTSDSETNGLRIIDGVHKTWDLLNSASNDHKKLYRSIITEDGCPTETLWKDNNTITSSEYSFLEWYHSSPSHKIEFALQNKSELLYTHFGPLEYRVRILREYMDKQKPRGFRQLWRDSRDSFNYYTFWGVIIFGAVSVFLAMASLAVSIAQTYASFKSLG
ncbi:uncharacterized protein EAE98_003989 [Botrytis deweyae]|uniref:Uncharacterized protein n=1 Tax=Botrytis deweyae TaxID=2478750 RepID=A0ABQ7ISA7_9HELO|nr:uncharacterized protein EAE98_003989 [Botrytis deweyae]KAF7932690.1 hypothetical protein EAE98_003989 [Botrytis deweyae]